MEAARVRGGLKLPARASLWYVVSSVIARGAGAVGTPIFTRLLSPEEYGLYPIYSSWLAVFSAIFTLEITGSTIYRVMGRHKGKEAEVSSAALGLTLFSSLLFSLLYGIFHRQIGGMTGLGERVGGLIILGVFINLPLSVYSAECRFSYRYSGVVAVNLTSAILTPVTAVILIRLTDLGAAARIVALLAVGFLSSLPVALRLLGRCRRLFSAKIWGELLRSALPLLPHALSLTLIIRTGEIAVRSGLGAEAMGKYAVATSLGLALTVLSSGLSSALTPWIMRRLGAGDEGRIAELLLTAAEGLALAILLFLCYAPEALSVIAPREYRDALPAVYPIALSLLPMLIAGAVSTAAVYHGRGGAVSRSSVIAAGVGALVAALGVRLGDFRLVGFTAAAAYVTLAALGIYDLKRLGSHPVRAKKTLGVFILLLFSSTLAFLLRESLAARFILSLSALLPLTSVGRKALYMIRERG